MKNLIIVVSILAFVSRTSSQNYTICPGASATLSAPAPNNLANPSYSLYPGGISSTNGQFVVTPTASATYTLYTTGTNSNSVMVTYSALASVTHPTVAFNLVSNQNFTLGCSSKSVTVVSSTVQVSPQLFSFTYSFVPPGGSTVLPPGSLAASPSHSINSPGNWTLVTRYHPGECDVKLPFSIMTNTAGPTIDSVVVPTQTLSCLTPSVLLEGYSNNPNTDINWWFSVIPSITGNTFVATSNTAQPTSSITTVYTLAVIDFNNYCLTMSVIPIYQNLFPPKAMISTGGNATITCSQPTIMLTNQSSTGIPPGIFPNNQPVIGALWEGPSIGPPAVQTSTYAALIGGTYTMTAKDLNNGCTGKTVVTIYDNRVYPGVQSPGDYNICGGINTVTLTPIITGNPGSLTYSWSSPPNATVSGVSGSQLVTNATGVYTLQVKNPEGCITSVIFNVVYCLSLEESLPEGLSIFPSPANAYVSIRGLSENAAKITVYDRCLRVVRTITGPDEPVYIGDLSPGIYCIVAEWEGGKKLARIVKD